MNEFSITPFRGPHLLLLFAVIMDIRPGYVDHRGCVPHTQALWSLNIFVGLDDKQEQPTVRSCLSAKL